MRKNILNKTKSRKLSKKKSISRKPKKNKKTKKDLKKTGGMKTALSSFRGMFSKYSVGDNVITWTTEGYGEIGQLIPGKISTLMSNNGYQIHINSESIIVNESQIVDKLDISKESQEKMNNLLYPNDDTVLRRTHDDYLTAHMHHVHTCPYILYRDNNRQYHKGQIIKMTLDDQMVFNQRTMGSNNYLGKVGDPYFYIVIPVDLTNVPNDRSGGPQPQTVVGISNIIGVYKYGSDILKRGVFTIGNNETQYKFELIRCKHTNSLVLRYTFFKRNVKEPSVFKYNNIFDATKKGVDTLEIVYYYRDMTNFKFKMNVLNLKFLCTYTQRPKEEELFSRKFCNEQEKQSLSNGIESTKSREITEWVELIKKNPFPQKEMLEWDNVKLPVLILKTGFFTLENDDIKSKFELKKIKNKLFLVSTSHPRFGEPSVVKYNNIFDARQKGNDTLEIDYYISEAETSNLIKSNPPLRIKTPSSSNGIEPTESTEITEWVDLIKKNPFPQELLSRNNTSITDSKK